ncbi:SDR family oxidoreductase [Peptoniphilus sp. KCTC 25270]|uniref:SDR family NAD(P)-dependent oxidoreductase n=1 Tax=Peptoniphilus sp. KCTC 25270 TaxID=2897414 RepID=UPI001E5DB5AF|nr:SDR family NAD(P)-dependent oxidoreductase [Peptoniphilus sp. KCTC 25270]MCD1146506.1 SDR family oxidoreductase [Peptoniphilus sp. KCTC 25270]
MLLKDKVAIITGATRGIGRAIAEEFLRHGAIVTICGSREATVSKALEEIKKEFPESKVFGKWPNLGNPEELDKLAKEIKEEFGSLDIMVNNAGVSDDSKTLEVSPERFKSVMDLNVNSVFYGCQAAAKIMKEQGYGCIINTSSMVSKNGQPSGVAYPSSKFAVNGLTISLARELGPMGIRVNAVAPGIINTDMVEQLPKEMIEPLIKAIPMRKIGEPKDIANGCVFLASDLASYVNGEILHIDGAMSV